MASPEETSTSESLPLPVTLEELQRLIKDQGDMIRDQRETIRELQDDLAYERASAKRARDRVSEWGMELQQKSKRIAYGDARFRGLADGSSQALEALEATVEALREAIRVNK